MNAKINLKKKNYLNKMKLKGIVIIMPLKKKSTEFIIGFIYVVLLFFNSLIIIITIVFSNIK